MRRRGRRARLLTVVVVLLALTPVANPATRGAAAHSPAGPLVTTGTAPAPLFDGDPATTERLVETDPVHAALAVSRARFDDAVGGARRATHAVLSRDDVFADSLAGSALTDTGPLLVTESDRLLPEVAAELRRVLGERRTVLLLGGTAALSDGVARDVARLGHDVRRLSGPTRVETALEIADEVRRRHPAREEVIVARAFGPGSAAWADAIAAGGLAAAAGVPIVVTHTDRLDAAVAGWLRRDDPHRALVLGGTAAISDAVLAQIPAAERVRGAERTATAAALAQVGWGAATAGSRRAVVIDASQPDAWAVGVAAAGLAADARAPVLTVTRDVLPATRDLLGTCGSPRVDVLVVGGGRFVSGSLRERIDALDGDHCAGRLRRTARLRPATSCPDLLAHLQQAALERLTPWGLDDWHGLAAEDTVVVSLPREGPPADRGAAGGDAEAPSAPVLAPTDASDDLVTGTNVQEVGVDEPDTVKADARRALAISRGAVQVIDLGGATPRIADTLTFGDAVPVSLLVHGDVGLVVADAGVLVDRRPTPVDTLPAAFGRRTPRTVLHRLDLADLDAVTITDTLELDAQHVAARMVDGVVRLAVAHLPAALPLVTPVRSDRAGLRAALDANRAAVLATDVDDWRTTATLRDGEGDVVAHGPLVDCRDVSLPPWFSGLGSVDLVTVDLATGLAPGATASVVATASTLYAAPERLVLSTTRWPDWEADTVDEAVGTELHTFDVADPDELVHVASGRVEGVLLSRWSLSWRADHLRVATTTLPAWLGGTPAPSVSQVVVLAEDGGRLDEVGRVGDLGPDETIRGVRFVGDRGYVVTFRLVDPLYVLDLSRPTAPRATGELEVTGYSAYLHPLRGGRLLGVGQEATDEGRPVGPAVSLFDVGDPSAPSLLDRSVLPGAGAFDAEHDARAFLHLPTSDQVVLPYVLQEAGGRFRRGARVYRAGTTELVDRGTVAHPPSESPGPISRAFVVDGVLHTVGWDGIATHDFDTLARTSWTPF